MSDHNDADARTAKYWARAADPGFRERHLQMNWLGHPEVQTYTTRLSSGDSTKPWLDMFLSTFGIGRRFREVTNLGCGDGALEQELIRRNFADSYLGLDLSEDCIHRARKTVGPTHPRARFEVADLNHVKLRERSCDILFFSHSLHHIEALERVCEEARRALRPDGFLLVHEFIGPNRMQWTPKQVEICNRLLRALPPYLKFDITRMPETVPKAEISRMPLDERLRCDASEAVRSADIIPVLTRSFEILDRRDWNGTILQKLLENIVGNFDTHNDDHNTIIRLLSEFEDILVKEDVLTSDFTSLIARPWLR